MMVKEIPGMRFYMKHMKSGRTREPDPPQVLTDVSKYISFHSTYHVPIFKTLFKLKARKEDPLFLSCPKAEE